jgi:hypothetical protein
MTDGEQIDVSDDPSWLLEPPDATDNVPPVNTLAQELPFGEISWQNFERLCHRLARTDGDVEYCRLYGTAGQEQGGIDIYVRRTATTKYATWQSKRHESFGPAKIETAVNEFIEGPWLEKSDRFVLCVKASLRSTDAQAKIEECAATLRERGVNFQPLDGEELSLRLKSEPQIVYDFFGLAWVERFCGKEAAEAVAKRLTPTEFRSLKSKLRSCYIAHFASVDPGVLSLLSSPRIPPSLTRWNTALIAALSRGSRACPVAAWHGRSLQTLPQDAGRATSACHLHSISRAGTSPSASGVRAQSPQRPVLYSILPEARPESPPSRALFVGSI